MPKKNSFRMSTKLFGGCLADMGPYAAGTARLLGSGKLLKMQTSVNKNKIMNNDFLIQKSKLHPPPPKQFRVK